MDNIDDSRIKTASMTVKILSQTDSVAVVGGYGVVFGGKDLEGDTFTKDTDLNLDLVPTKPTFYDHTLNAQVKTAVLGNVIKAEADEFGLWVEAELDKHNQYVDHVLNLVEKGALGWSSGSVPHLVRRDASKNITEWPIVEFSLTPTPAEPRTIGVTRLKNLNIQLNQEEPLKMAQDTISDSTAEADNNINPLDLKEETKIMTEQTETAVAPELDIQAIVSSAVKEAVAETTKAFNAQKPSVKAGFAPTDAPKVSGVKLLNNFMRYGSGHATTRHLSESGVKVITTDVDATVGFLVEEDWMADVFTPKQEGELINDLMFDTMSVEGKHPIHIQSADAPTAAVLTAECDDYADKNPSVSELLLSPEKYTCTTTASVEILNDSRVPISSWLAERAGISFRLARNSKAVALVKTGTVGHTTALPTAFTFDDLYELYFSVPHQYRNMGTQKWVMADATMQFITTLEDNEARKYINFNPVESIPMTIFGREVVISNEMDAITNSLFPVAFGNFSSVKWANWNTMEFLRNPYITDPTTNFPEGKVQFSWWARWNGILPTGLNDSFKLMQMAA